MRSFLTLVAFTVSLVGLTGLAAETSVPNASVQGLRVYTAGHSFHHWVAPLIREIADLAKIEGHEVAGVSIRGGSTVQMVWEAQPGEETRKALATGKVDVLTLSPIWLPDEGIEKFVRFGLEHNPNLRVTVQAFWLPNDEYQPIYPLETKKFVDHNVTDLVALREANRRYEHDLDELVRDLNRRLGRDVVVIVPVGAASVALREKIVAGQAPGLRVQWRLFADSWGHATTPLKVLAAYCHYAVIYGKSPVGLPLPGEFQRNQEYANERLNRLLQELAWETVAGNPLTGVKSEARPVPRS